MGRHVVIIMRQCHECATCVPEPCTDQQDYVLCTRHKPANDTPSAGQRKTNEFFNEGMTAHV